MREAAADYAKRQRHGESACYLPVHLHNFPEEEYLPIRRAAESSLHQLNDMEKEPK